MNTKMTFRLTNYVLILTTISFNYIQCSDGTGVPVLIWRNERSQTYDLIPKSSLITQIDSNDLRNDYLKESQTIIAFIQKDLSIEQFSTEDKSRFKTLNNIFSDKTVEPILLTDVLSPNEALKDFSVQNINELNVNNGNKIAINLPKNSLVENDELIGDLLHKISQNVSKNTLYLITGRQNSQYSQHMENDEQISDKHRIRRHISERLDERSLNDDMNRLVTVSDTTTKKGCLFLYISSLFVKSLSNSTNIITTFDTSKPEVNPSNCFKNNGIEPALLDVTYKNSANKIQIKFSIGKNRNDFWRLNKNSSVLLAIDGREPMEFDLIFDDISAENQFSYSCSKLTVLGKSEKYGVISLAFDRFQLQPFESVSNKYIFSDSSDCRVWMSLAQWMGLLTLILFSTIVLIGVYILSKVNTGDRFENPKAKPLIITNADE